MRLSEGNPFKTCTNPQAHNQKLSRANVYGNEVVKTYRDLNVQVHLLFLGLLKRGDQRAVL